MVDPNTKRNLTLAGIIVTAILGMVLFGLSASQTVNKMQASGYTDDMCTDLDKGQFMALLGRPTQFVVKADIDRGDSGKTNKCAWKSVNSGIRMSTTLLTFLSACLASYGCWIDSKIPLWIHTGVMFVTAALLTGCMCFDADDSRTSSEWCGRGDNRYSSPPSGSSCDYSPYTTTILVECAVFIVFFAFSVYLFIYAREVARRYSGRTKMGGAAAGGAAAAPVGMASTGAGAATYGQAGYTQNGYASQGAYGAQPAYVSQGAAPPPSI